MTFVAHVTWLVILFSACTYCSSLSHTTPSGKDSDIKDVISSSGLPTTANEDESRAVRKSTLKSNNANRNDNEIVTTSSKEILTKPNGEETLQNDKDDESGDSKIPAVQNKDKSNRKSPTSSERNGANKGRMKHVDRAFGKRRRLILEGNVLCTNLNNETTNQSESCLRAADVSAVERHLMLYSIKYTTLAFSFVINLINIVFHSRQANRANSSLYVITMNVVEMLSLVLDLISFLIYNKSNLTQNISDNDLMGAIFYRHAGSWIKQGSYLAHLLFTIERFQVVKYPLRYLQIWNVCKAKIILFSVLALFVVSNFIGVFVSVELSSEVDKNLFSRWNIITGTLFTVLPVATIFILNGFTCVVFIKENNKICQTCDTHVSQLLQKRQKKMTISLFITTTILIVTATPFSLWVIFLSTGSHPNHVYRLVTEVLSVFSYFGNSVAFISLMALNVVTKRKFCSCCFSSAVSSYPVSKARLTLTVTHSSQSSFNG